MVLVFGVDKYKSFIKHARISALRKHDFIVFFCEEHQYKACQTSPPGNFFLRFLF